jgi:putative nucleotidyltransferase with HDIG domain
MGRNRVQIGAHGDESLIEGLMERGSVLNFVQDLVDHIDTGQGAVEHRTDAARWAGLLADELGLDAGQRWRASAAARLHDIGKVGVPRDEGELLRHHPDVGADILLLAPGLRDVARVVREHHEHFDGSGYPAGLSGEEICIEARIVAVCDDWVALRSEPSTAVAELRRAAGSRLDPRVVDAAVRLAARTEDLAVSAS